MTTPPGPSDLAPYDLVCQAKAWRQSLHMRPELLYDVPETASFVAEKLRQFGCDRVEAGIGRTGVVGVISGQQNTRNMVVGLRADMDALPIKEAGAHSYRSLCSDRMHACGHDGHMAMLLGAAKHLADTRRFNGSAVLIFQPAEEGGKGAEAMIKDGLMERFGIHEVYGLHNMPGIPLGHFAIKDGPMLAASDRFKIEIEGSGGHAARPHECIDAVLIAAHLTTALQSIVSRNLDPLHPAVISVTALQAGETYNVIPQGATLLGTVRTLHEDDRKTCERRVRDLAAAICQGFGAVARTHYEYGHPVTSNHAEQAGLMAETIEEMVGRSALDSSFAPIMGSEDFSFMLRERPGAYVFLGNGKTMPLHHPEYDFCDDAIPYGIALWIRLIEKRLPPVPAS